MVTGSGAPGSGGVRELLVVLALAVLGLLVAGVAALTPWYSATADDRPPPVVRVEPPGRTVP